MFQTKVVEKIQIHILCSVIVFFSENRAFYEMMWKNMVDNMTSAHCMVDNQRYKYTQSGCVTLIAFPQQQWLHESASVLRYTYSTLLVLLSNTFLSFHLTIAVCDPLLAVSHSNLQNPRVVLCRPSHRRAYSV